MSLEKEFLYYSSKLRSTQTSSNTDVCNSIDNLENLTYIGGDNCTYLNIKLVMSKELLEEINVVSETLGITPEATLANYVQYGNDIRLVPIVPKIKYDEDMDYDVIYYIDVNDDYYMENDN